MGFVSADRLHDDGLRVPVLEDLPDPAGKRALVRATLNREIATDPARPLALRRARGLAATIDWLVSHGAEVTVCGDTRAADEAGAQRRLGTIRRAMHEACSSPDVFDALSLRSLRASSEGLRAVGRLVADHDLFVNDSLQDSFLPLPTLVLPPRSLPSAAGRTLQDDLAIFDRSLTDPARPFVVVLGGERSFDRLHGLEGLVLRADTVLLGGALALPMLQALGSLPSAGATESFLWECRAILGLSQRVRHRLVLPVDLVWQRADGSPAVVTSNRRGGDTVVDVGPTTRVRFAEVVQGASTVLWAGALGMVEQKEFAAGTQAVGWNLPSSASVVIGGDALAEALQAAGLLPASAAMLSATDAAVELLKNGDLPALAALRGT